MFIDMRRLYILLSILSIVSCVKYEDAPEVPAAAGDVVDVNLNLSIAGLDTKTVHDPESIESVTDVIKNLWVIQFNGTTDDSEVIGEPVYIEDFTSFDGRLKLVASSKECVIWLIANTFEGVGVFNVPQGTTLADLKNKRRLVTVETDILSKETNDLLHPIFNGSITATVTEGLNLSARLKRNIAKVHCTVTNRTSGKAESERVVIETITFRSVPSVSYYVNNFDPQIVPFPALSSFSKIDYESVAWQPDGDNSMQLDAYLPANLRGSVPSNTSAAMKNKYAPDGSTYLQVLGHYTLDGVDYPVTYSFYLGENLVDDFNVTPNRMYTYSFEINSRGEADLDSRIEDWGLVDFSDTKYELANSYILNPPPSSWRNFRIPIQRIHDFWGTQTVKDYEDSEYLSLRNKSDKWKAFILASDFDLSDGKFKVTKSQGKTGTDTYFEVQISSDVKRGNVLIAVGPDDNSGNVSWSWHLWITDYNPEVAITMGNGTEGQYVYAVTGGSVHRYLGSSLWSRYKHRYMMDRNLGYTDKVYMYPIGNEGLLYYQYGRKDPFFYPKSETDNNYIYPADKTNHSFRSIENSETTVGAYNTVTYAVTHPLHFIRGTQKGHEGSLVTWCHGTVYNPDPVDRNIRWYDPLTTQGAKREGDKSIFDPCPPGFRLPPTSTWEDFKINSHQTPTTNVLKNTSDETLHGFKDFVEAKGLQYWPYMENQLISDDTVFYPASGYVNPAVGGGYLQQAGQWTFAWAERPYSYDKGYGITAQPAMLSPTHTTGQGRALPVRCITDN